MDKEQGAAMKMTAAMKQVWEDAYWIAYIGACNPAGVAKTIHEDICALYKMGYSPESAARHQAIRAMVGHLYYLCGIRLGPETADLEAVIREHGEDK